MKSIRSTLGSLVVFLVVACSGSDKLGGNFSPGDPANPNGGTPNINTGSGGSSTINTGSGGMSNGGSTGVVVDPNTACVADASEGEQAPIDLYIMVDKSGSMKCSIDQTADDCNNNGPSGTGTTRWDAVTTALDGFVGAPANAGIGVGLGYFPRAPGAATQPDPACMAACTDCDCMAACGCPMQECRCSTRRQTCSCGGGGNSVSCDAADYKSPTFEVAALPGSAMGFTNALSMIQPNGSTPTVPALDGALQHAKDWITAHPERRVAVVYSTDGEPEGCDNTNTVDTAAADANAAFKATPSIPTYVIGVGPSLDNLNAIAVGGGTEKAYLVGTGDVAKQFSDALASIRSRSLSCDYNIPTTKGALDYSLVNVQVTVGTGGMATIIPQSASPTQCGTTSAWYYDDPAAPKVITLCPTICDQLLKTAGSKLQVLIGCATIPTDVH